MLSHGLVLVAMLGAVAFFIVIERKGLGMVQRRQGPNKVGLKGLAQPLADGVKLFKKEYEFTWALNSVTYVLGPLLVFSCAYCLYVIFPIQVFTSRFELGVLFLVCVSSFSVYGVIFTGWMCNSRYSLFGCMRGVAQSISYEVFMSMVLFGVLTLFGSYDLDCVRFSKFSSASVGLMSLGGWFLAALAETNRAPFDFVEGESELVAGYMTEVGGVGFALLALGEYSNMIFMAMMTGVIFFNAGMGQGLLGDLLFCFWVVGFSYAFVLVRGATPRFRYDLLMEACWKSLLPVSLGAFSLYLAGL